MAKKSDGLDVLKTRNDAVDSTKRISIDVLQAYLSNAIDLTKATRQAHWNVKRPHFSAPRALLEAFYGQLAEGTDEIAERIVQLGGIAYGTNQSITEATGLELYPVELLAGLDPARALLPRYAAVAKALRAGINETAETGGADTADQLTGQSRTLDKALWILEAYLQSDTGFQARGGS